MNVLKPHLRITVQTLLAAGRSQREIERMTGVDRKTIRHYGQEMRAAAANSPTLATGFRGRESEDFSGETPPPRPPPQPPKLARSAWEEHREWIEGQVALGRNAVSIYQDLVDRMGFAHRYNALPAPPATTSCGDNTVLTEA